MRTLINELINYRKLILKLPVSILGGRKSWQTQLGALSR